MVSQVSFRLYSRYRNPPLAPCSGTCVTQQIVSMLEYKVP